MSRIVRKARDGAAVSPAALAGFGRMTCRRATCRGVGSPRGPVQGVGSLGSVGNFGSNVPVDWDANAPSGASPRGTCDTVAFPSGGGERTTARILAESTQLLRATRENNRRGCPEALARRSQIAAGIATPASLRPTTSTTEHKESRSWHCSVLAAAARRSSPSNAN